MVGDSRLLAQIFLLVAQNNNVSSTHASNAMLCIEETVFFFLLYSGIILE